MALSINLPEAIEEQLRVSISNLQEVAKEAALVEFYRRGKLTHHELSTALGLDRFEAESVLKRHAVAEDLISPLAFQQQLATLRKLVEI
jgi:hypothetical protein